MGGGTRRDRVLLSFMNLGFLCFLRWGLIFENLKKSGESKEIYFKSDFKQNFGEMENGKIENSV